MFIQRIYGFVVAGRYYIGIKVPRDSLMDRICYVVSKKPVDVNIVICANTMHEWK